MGGTRCATRKIQPATRWLQMRIEAYRHVQEYEKDRVFHIGSEEWPPPAEANLRLRRKHATGRSPASACPIR